jgi:CRISPR-associated protein Cas1
MSTTLSLDLIPVRALNQVTYCPRLYYLEYVEALMTNNEHVEGGLFDHRRIDDPELANRTRKDGSVLHTRSISLSSERLGISAKLDLIEERDGETYPVEYKRGSGPRDDAGQKTAWDNDAVQLCAQGLLLEEELGLRVTRGVLYYIGARERVEVQLDAELREKTLHAISQIRDLSSRPSPPEPLPAELRHRCPGCSLLTVCQPEETLYQIERAQLPPGDAPAGLTRVIPQSDDGAVLYLQEPGSRVGKRSAHLVVSKDSAELNRVPLAMVRQVVVFGNVQVSTQALETLASNNVPVMYLTGYGRFVGAFMPAPTKNINLRQDQYRRFSDPAEALSLAKEVVRAKLTNQRALLMRSLRSRSPASATEEEASGVCEHPGETATRGSEEPAARDMAELLVRLDRVKEVESLLGLEGQGASLYFGEFSRFLKAQPPGRGFDFQSRNRRPPRDPINALLSFAYALLCKDCFSALCTVGFDPYCGFYHVGRHGRPSLALDLMEEFRAVIADSVVLTLVNNRVVTPEDFLTWRAACQLTESGRKKFFQAYEQRKATVITHPIFGYRMSYSRMLEVQARMLAAYIRGDIPRYTGFTVR